MVNKTGWASTLSSANTNVQTNNTNTMNNTNPSIDITKDVRNATGFRIYENVKGYQESTFNRDAFLACGRITNTYHGSLFRNRKTEAVFGHFNPLPEAMDNQPGYHAIIELLFPNGQTRTLTQNETMEFWAIALGLPKDSDLPFFRIKYQLDMHSSEVIDMIEEGEFRSLVFEFNDIKHVFKYGGIVNVPGIKGSEEKTRDEFVFYPARGYHTVKVGSEIRESDELLMGINFPHATLIDESVKNAFVLPLHKVTKSSIRRPSRRAAAAAAAAAPQVSTPVVTQVTPEVQEVVETIVEPVVEEVSTSIQTTVAVESAAIANESVEEVVEETAVPVASASLASGGLFNREMLAKLKAGSSKLAQEVKETSVEEPTPAPKAIANKKVSSLLDKLTAKVDAKVASMSGEEKAEAGYAMRSDVD